jgi:hypothetical protein
LFNRHWTSGSITRRRNSGLAEAVIACEISGFPHDRTNLHFTGLLCGVVWQVVNHISGQYIDRIYKVQATQEEFDDCWTQNASNQIPTYAMLTSQKNEGLDLVLLGGRNTRVCKRKNTQAKATCLISNYY